MTRDYIGPIQQRIPAAIRSGTAYHVAKPRTLRAKLDANELPYGLPPELRAELAAALAEVPLERYPDPNATALREVVALQHAVLPEQLVFGNGSDELISMLANLAPGPILYPSPSFVYYKLAAVARGLPAVEVPLRADFTLDEPAMVAAIEQHRPTLVFLALPNNPTGTLWRPAFAVELAARFPDTLIISDEAYAAYANITNLPHLATHANLVIMRTLSKIGLAGLRVGYTITSVGIAGMLERVRPPYNVSALDQRAALFALERASSWCRDRAADVVRERARLAAALCARGLEVFPSEANLVLVRFPDGPAAYARLFAAGIAVRSFGDAGPLAGCLRITVGTPAETDALLAAL